MHRSCLTILAALLFTGHASSQRPIDLTKNTPPPESSGLPASEAYSLDPDWPRLPPGIQLGQVTGVGVDSHNHVFVFHRADRSWTRPFPTENIPEPTIFVFDGDTGELLKSFGTGKFVLPHGLSVDHDDHIWVTDVGSQQIHELSHDDGAILLTIGERGVQGDDQNHFALPTDVAITKDRGIYVSDGYANTRVVKFDSTGKFEFQWGTPGTQPGSFDLPHGIAVTENRVYVADRSNLRLQIFDDKGGFVSEWKGGNIGRPFGVATNSSGEIFVIDGGDQPNHTRSRVIILNEHGTVIHTFNAAVPSDKSNLGHDIAVGKDGAVYVADTWAKTVRKFTKSD